jgi:hypothetical protein
MIALGTLRQESADIRSLWISEICGYLRDAKKGKHHAEFELDAEASKAP